MLNRVSRVTMFTALFTGNCNCYDFISANGVPLFNDFRASDVSKLLRWFIIAFDGFIILSVRARFRVQAGRGSSAVKIKDKFFQLGR